MIGSIPALRNVLELEADLAQWQTILAFIHSHEPATNSAELRRLNRLGPETGQPLLLVRLGLDAPYAQELAL